MAEKILQLKLTLGEMTNNGREKIVSHVRAVSLWGTHLTCHEFVLNAAVGVSKLC